MSGFCVSSPAMVKVLSPIDQQHWISIHIYSAIASFSVLLIWTMSTVLIAFSLVFFFSFKLRHSKIHFTRCPDSFLFSFPLPPLFSASSLFISLFSLFSSSSSAYDHQHTDGKPVSLLDGPFCLSRPFFFVSVGSFPFLIRPFHPVPSFLAFISMCSFLVLHYPLLYSTKTCILQSLQSQQAHSLVNIVGASVFVFCGSK